MRMMPDTPLAMREVRTHSSRSACEPRGAVGRDFLRGPESGDLDLDAVFDALGVRRRRIVLHHLRSRADEWVSLEELVDRVLAWEVELGDPSTVSDGSVETDLVHRHLPKLDSLGVVEYDQERERATFSGSDRLGRFLDLSLREGPLP